MISELPSGNVEMHTVNYSGGTIGFPGGVNWDRMKGQLVINDQECQGLYSFVRVPVDSIGFEREDRGIHPAEQLRRHCLRRRSRHDRSVQQVLRGPVHQLRVQRELGGSLGVSVGRYAGSLQRLRWSSNRLVRQSARSSRAFHNAGPDAPSDQRATGTKNTAHGWGQIR